MRTFQSFQLAADRLRGFERRYVDKGRVSCPHHAEFGADVERCLACTHVVEAHLGEDPPYITCAPADGPTATAEMPAGWEHY